MSLRRCRSEGSAKDFVERRLSSIFIYFISPLQGLFPLMFVGQGTKVDIFVPRQAYIAEQTRSQTNQIREIEPTQVKANHNRPQMLQYISQSSRRAASLSGVGATLIRRHSSATCGLSSPTSSCTVSNSAINTTNTNTRRPATSTQPPSAPFSTSAAEATDDGSNGKFSIRGKFREGRASYLDMSATTPLDPRVLDKMMPFMVITRSVIPMRFLQLVTS